jgi:hypothetical protein
MQERAEAKILRRDIQELRMKAMLMFPGTQIAAEMLERAAQMNDEAYRLESAWLRRHHPEVLEERAKRKRKESK